MSPAADDAMWCRLAVCSGLAIRLVGRRKTTSRPITKPQIGVLISPNCAIFRCITISIAGGP